MALLDPEGEECNCVSTHPIMEYTETKGSMNVIGILSNALGLNPSAFKMQPSPLHSKTLRSLDHSSPHLHIEMSSNEAWACQHHSARVKEFRACARTWNKEGTFVPELHTSSMPQEKKNDTNEASSMDHVRRTGGGRCRYPGQQDSD